MHSSKKQQGFRAYNFFVHTIFMYITTEIKACLEYKRLGIKLLKFLNRKKTKARVSVVS